MAFWVIAGADFCICAARICSSRDCGSFVLTELVHEILIYEGGRMEILLNFQDELQALTDYLELNRDALEEVCVN